MSFTIESHEQRDNYIFDLAFNTLEQSNNRVITYFYVILYLSKETKFGKWVSIEEALKSK